MEWRPSRFSSWVADLVQYYIVLPGSTYGYKKIPIILLLYYYEHRVVALVYGLLSLFSYIDQVKPREK